MNKTLKTIFIILGVLIFGAVLIFGLKNSATNTTTATTTISTSSTVYTNNTFGFNVTLSKSWEGYTVSMDIWSGYKIDDQLGDKPYATGTVISIHNPKWTEAVHYQDIPIMVFTTNEWNLITQEKMSVGAAPIPPSELARNSKYVFALPARYNYAYPLGWEEVDQIIQSKTLTTFEPKP